MEENKGENLPTIQKEKDLATIRDRADFLSRAKKIGKGIGILFGGVTVAGVVSAIGVPAVPIVLLGGTVLASARNLRDISYKTEPRFNICYPKS